VEAEISAFATAGCRVVILSFGAPQGAEAWLSDTKSSLDLYLDPDRQLYALLGLARSVAKVWGMRTVQFYAGEKARGRQLPSALSGLEDDPLQMGGDFTLNKDLRLVMSHPSKVPTDRPTVQQILQIVRQ